MKYYIIAGEASGDLHGSNLIKALQQADPGAQFRCWGGDKMQAAGGHIVKHIKHLAFMGFFEVVKHLGTILNNISFCKRDILQYKPDVVILIDYPGFNFRLFKFLKQHRFKIFYYISPQLWAWKTSRVYKVKEYVDRMFVIFPFEKEFYARYGVEVDFVGHPLLDELQIAGTRPAPTEKIIAILPGSRKQEIAYLLPEYLKVIDEFPEYRFVIAGLSSIGEKFYQDIIGASRCEIVYNNTYQLLESSTAAIVTSGTATLETALHNVPEVICYKGSWISYYIARALIKNINYICIVNLICDKRVVEELIQADVNKERLIAGVKKILSPEGRAVIRKDYSLLYTKLGDTGASARTAGLMVKYLRQ
ncbi:MAG TPA: lipid-A-disaccharide synthase [Chitinophagales bacterium]|nr:lipid-A-disaccharide synthase [Chitinophagales bacterium]